MSDDLRTAWRALAVKRGLTLGALRHAREDDFRLVLTAAAATLTHGRIYREPEVNGALRDWLGGPGTMLNTDHVELRRWLVDMGLLVRDGYGRAYERATSLAFTLIEKGLAHLDLAAEAADARSAFVRERERRRAAYEATREHP